MQYLTVEPLTLLQLISGGRRGGTREKMGVEVYGRLERGTRSGRNRGKLLQIAQYFAIKKILKRGGSTTKTGREPGYKGTRAGKFNPPASS